MVKPADIGKLEYLPEFWWLQGARIWTVHVQRSVDPPAMIVLEVAGEDAFQMALVHYDDVVETLSPDGADQSLDVGVLPR
jgi:hypothetical protein